MPPIWGAGRATLTGTAAEAGDSVAKSENSAAKKRNSAEVFLFFAALFFHFCGTSLYLCRTLPPPKVRRGVRLWAGKRWCPCGLADGNFRCEGGFLRAANGKWRGDMPGQGNLSAFFGRYLKICLYLCILSEYVCRSSSPPCPLSLAFAGWGWAFRNVNLRVCRWVCGRAFPVRAARCLRFALSYGGIGAKLFNI